MTKYWEEYSKAATPLAHVFYDFLAKGRNHPRKARFSVNRRPDVTVAGEQVTIHSIEDRAPVPLSVHHIPVCVTFAFYDNGNLMLVDPTDREESVMDGEMMIAMNVHRELCGVQMNGGLSLEAEQVIRCSKICAVKVTEITELIQKALNVDEEARKSGKLSATGITQNVRSITAATAEESEMDVSNAIQVATSESHSESEESHDTENLAQLKGLNTAEIGLGGWNTWIESDDVVEEDASMEEDKTSGDEQHNHDELRINGESSEEEEKVVLTSSNITDFEEKKITKCRETAAAAEERNNANMVKQARSKRKKKKAKHAS